MRVKKALFFLQRLRERFDRFIKKKLHCLFLLNIHCEFFKSMKKPNTPACFVSTLDTNLKGKLKEDLLEQGFSLSEPPYTIFAAKKKGVSCTLYQSGKLVVQGKEMTSFIEFYLEPEILKDFSFTYNDLSLDLESRIGVDESGKGDFLGPLCVAGVYADEGMIKKLNDMGVKDSKKMTDKKILELKKKIVTLCPYHLIIISPKKYNELYDRFKNLNSLLAWGHATCIENLFHKTGCSNVHIDKFANEHVVDRAVAAKKLDFKIRQSHKGEADIVIAAASIIARGAFVQSLESMEQEFGQEFPKGASNRVKGAARQFMAKFSVEALSKVCKMHFKTYEMIVSETKGSNYE
ncbi:Ribonuclease HIII [Chlamydiales bacterium SCGC AB-751-O23]|jgi:ribonuclease HIII|nr:Ribonuclease HIII [Chlamydiales bacterium SCGC AB-751-O23]